MKKWMLNNFPKIPYNSSSWKGPVCQTLWKAFDISIAKAREPPNMQHFLKIDSQIKNPETILKIWKYTAFLEVLHKPSTLEFLKDLQRLQRHGLQGTQNMRLPTPV